MPFLAPGGLGPWLPRADDSNGDFQLSAARTAICGASNGLALALPFGFPYFRGLGNRTGSRQPNFFPFVRSRH
jgi:hypothetical protein